MPILKRDDGIQFAIHAYRELLEARKVSLLRNEIRMLAQNHGEYVRLFQQSAGQIEAVFSRDPGFLLGEAVWEHFGKPSDLVYCEALPEGHAAIVVVVRGGSVYLDTKIPYSNIADEFASLVTGANRYSIYIYGDVPVTEIKAHGKFNFAPTQIKSFTRLEQSVFKNLVVNDQLQLQPLELALSEEKFGKKFPWTWLITAILALGIIWWFYNYTTTKPVSTAASTTEEAPPPDPFAGYKAALNTAAPEKAIAELASTIDGVYLIPGWATTGVTFAGGVYTIQLASIGGPLVALDQWAHSHNMNMSISSQGAILTMTSNLQNRATPTTIYPLRQVLYSVVDNIDQVLAAPSVTLGTATPTAAYQSLPITVQFTSIAPDVLSLIGRQLANLPIQFNSAQITFNQGLLSGTLQLTILGN